MGDHEDDRDLPPGCVFRSPSGPPPPPHPPSLRRLPSSLVPRSSVQAAPRPFGSLQSPITTRLVSVPMLSMVTETSSPSVSGPTPAGVPVSRTSPGSSVITWLTYAISPGTSHSISDVRACCLTSPFTTVVSPRSSGFVPVSIHGPSGQNVSNPLALVHCPSLACRSRSVTSLAQV